MTDVEMRAIRREFGRWFLRLTIGQVLFLLPLAMAANIIRLLGDHGRDDLAFLVALPTFALIGCNLVWLWDHRTWRSSSRSLPEDVLLWLYETYTPEGREIWRRAYDEADDAKRAHMLAIARMDGNG